MELVHGRCAGLDVHKEEVVAAVRVVERGRLEQVTERFGTTTEELLRLGDWLEGWRIRDVVMEATGVYWKPVWHILEERFALVLVNAREVRNRPGRKSDVSDAAWLAELLAFGLVRGSFVPPAPIQQMRDLTRARTQLVHRIGQGTLRLQKVLEDANIKITGVVTDVLGTSGRAIVRALIEGETDPERLLARTTGRLKAPRERHQQRVERLAVWAGGEERVPPLPRQHLPQGVVLGGVPLQDHLRAGGEVEPPRDAHRQGEHGPDATGPQAQAARQAHRAAHEREAYLGEQPTAAFHRPPP